MKDHMLDSLIYTFYEEAAPVPNWIFDDPIFREIKFFKKGDRVQAVRDTESIEGRGVPGGSTGTITNMNVMGRYEYPYAFINIDKPYGSYHVSVPLNDFTLIEDKKMHMVKQGDKIVATRDTKSIFCRPIAKGEIGEFIKNSKGMNPGSGWIVANFGDRIGLVVHKYDFEPYIETVFKKDDTVECIRDTTSQVGNFVTKGTVGKVVNVFGSNNTNQGYMPVNLDVANVRFNGTLADGGSDILTLTLAHFKLVEEETVPMEKITCVIGRPGAHSHAGVASNRTDHEDMKFLQEALEISFQRAKSLVNQMASQVTASRQKLTVDLNYRQYARYAAMRRTPVSLGNYWISPTVSKFVECVPAPAPQPETIELRPGRRTVPCNLGEGGGGGHG